jgi:hypothetical protein
MALAERRVNNPTTLTANVPTGDIYLGRAEANTSRPSPAFLRLYAPGFTPNVKTTGATMTSASGKLRELRFRGSKHSDANM